MSRYIPKNIFMLRAPGLGIFASATAALQRGIKL
jgi:hypothetical protein